MSIEACVVIPTYNEECYITWPLYRLQLEASIYGPQSIPVVVVDNGSTDDTKGMVEYVKTDFKNLNLHIIDEAEKGTGCATDTGVDFAIHELGASVILRTDADTGPIAPWYNTSIKRHRDDPALHILTGPCIPKVVQTETTPQTFELQAQELRDRDLLGSGAILYSTRVTRVLRAIRYCDPAFIYAFAPGYNLSTTALAYKETGGFPRTSIEELDEDVAYNLKIRKNFGFRAKKFDRNMAVDRSMRREKLAGYIASTLHYGRPTSRTEANIDLR